MELVYIETTIISYLVANPSRDPLLAAHQGVTRDWWERDSSKYQLVVSDEVLREIQDGDPAMARRRLQAIQEIPVTPISTDALELSERFLRTRAVPASIKSDTVHLAVAVTTKVDYLLTWNCRHIAKAHILRRLEREVRKLGLEMPHVCTPLELAGVAPDVQE